jgi:hypothetical protein
VKRRKGLLDEEKFLPPLPEQLPRGASSLLGYGQGPGMQVFQEAADVGRGLFGATPIIEGGEGYRTGQALANIPPIAAGLGVIKAPGKAGQLISAVPNMQRSVRPTAQELALQVAQKNAALPVEQGGLGLLASNTPEMRAAALGYRDYYHGTERLDRLLEGKSFDPKRATSGPMPFGAAEQELASKYATSKRDTSRLAQDEGDVSNYFTVSAKDIGLRSKADIPVEKAFYYLSPEQRAEITKRARQVGYENPEEATGNIIFHPERSNASVVSDQTFDYYLNKEARGNPLTALRQIWHDSGTLYGDEEKLADVFRAAGFPVDISQKNAPWTTAQGVFAGKARLQNPLMTTDSEALESRVIPALKEAFKKDRTVKKDYGPDQWAKDVRFTPKEWVNELEADLAAGKNSFVWTSIPDKVTAELKKLGYDGILDVGGKGGGSPYQVVIPFEAKQVRSKFAAFDPMRKDEADLLAGIGTVGAGLLSPAVLEYLRRRDEEGM